MIFIKPLLMGFTKLDHRRNTEIRGKNANPNIVGDIRTRKDEEGNM
jgi:hypothetical protein